MAKDNGIVNIHGKEYQTVALRVGKFREEYGNTFSLETEIIYADEKVVRMKATIKNPEDRIIATGHAEEYRSSSNINKNSALENAETSAIGRALASMGMGGTEFASADEVARAISGKPSAPTEPAVDPVPYLRQIENATNLDELKKIYVASVRACGELSILESAKDTKKTQLAITK